ncbi:MAG: haloacid dehalogenase-like hydrolase [Prevotella sp.]|jgi:HAD superfamily hydrolase (TIGR01490 family)|uniref:Haloacid dehalogenase-like hydrolase n=1 Tax=Segatella cerevisiae TaxID=2053716 RepID=A0ABT1BWP7_9BACT|nr:HAD family hydrolase [Segatella cerevisiae]MCH3995198.1 haloacid dehalogenase-like hydrolase [Prevotella sp.]MCI1246028.1 haloacid dehalogenase-like hydrolase [Prevotella sp.]MCO6025255.1 haloacid dehalogenase-like hydrolase [Segatella cerevisiae]
MKKEKIYCFDFDGTLTYKDTLIEFIRYSKGTLSLFAGFLFYSPLLILMKLHLYPNWKVKQKIFTLYYKGMRVGYFDQLCHAFANDRSNLLRWQAFLKIAEVLRQGAQVMIVSASPDSWVRPFVGEGPVVIGTQLEVVDGRLTGRFKTKNCYGQEKVNRIKEVLKDPREHYEIFAYGDSRGDKEMLDFADKGFYKPFRD